MEKVCIGILALCVIQIGLCYARPFTKRDLSAFETRKDGALSRAEDQEDDLVQLLRKYLNDKSEQVDERHSVDNSKAASNENPDAPDRFRFAAYNRNRIPGIPYEIPPPRPDHKQEKPEKLQLKEVIIFLKYLMAGKHSDSDGNQEDVLTTMKKLLGSNA